MDVAPSLYQPTKPIVYIPLNISKLDDAQKLLINSIFYKFMLKIDPNSLADISDNEWKRDHEDTSTETDFLLEILGIVEKEMPSTVADINARADFILEESSNKLIEMIETVTETINQWYNQIDSDLIVLETTLPHLQEYKDKLKIYSEDHTALIQGDYANLIKREIGVATRIKTRITSYEERKTTQPSLDLIVNIHDIELKYLENSIQNYRERTNKIKVLSNTLALKTDEMKKARFNFEYAYCLLDYTVANNMKCDRSNIAFNTGWKTGYYKMPTNLKPNQNLEIKYKTQPPTVLTPPNIFQLKREQTECLLQIFANLCNKKKILTGNEEELFEIPICQHAQLDPFLKMAYAWKPLLNFEKIKKDHEIEQSVDQLNTLINTTITKFDMWDQQYRAQLIILKPGQPKQQDIEDLRKRDMDNYAKVSAEELNTISTQRKQLEEKINQRIQADAKDKISDTSLRIICNSLDIKMDKIKSNIKEYHEQTQKFKTILTTLSELIQTMNVNITNFRKSFEYFSFLYENGLENTTGITGNQMWFDTWYALGFYITIQKGNFKAPPPGATLPILTSGGQDAPAETIQDWTPINVSESQSD